MARGLGNAAERCKLKSQFLGGDPIMTSAIDSFFEAWGLEDGADRSAKISEALAPEAVYADPRTPDPLTGPEAVSAYVAMFAENAPGAVAVVIDSQTQHGLTRATVAFRMPNGMEQLGQYIVEMDGDQITAMTGFVGTGEPQ